MVSMKFRAEVIFIQFSEMFDFVVFAKGIDDTHTRFVHEPRLQLAAWLFINSFFWFVALSILKRNTKSGQTAIEYILDP